MSQKREQSGRLGKLELKVIQILAEEGPRTIYGIYKETTTQYNSAWKACKNLERKGFIQKVDGKYWLTSKGILAALTNEKLDVKKLLRNIEQTKNKDFSAFAPFINWLSSQKKLLRVLASSIFLPLYEKGLDLDRKLSDKEMEDFQKAIEGSPEPFRELFEAFLNLREMIYKGKEG
jgi:predicted transcriptional regulator